MFLTSKIVTNDKAGAFLLNKKFRYYFTSTVIYNEGMMRGTQGQPPK